MSIFGSRIKTPDFDWSWAAPIATSKVARIIGPPEHRPAAGRETRTHTVRPGRDSITPRSTTQSLRNISSASALCRVRRDGDADEDDRTVVARVPNNESRACDDRSSGCRRAARSGVATMQWPVGLPGTGEDSVDSGGQRQGGNRRAADDGQPLVDVLGRARGRNDEATLVDIGNAHVFIPLATWVRGERDGATDFDADGALRLPHRGIAGGGVQDGNDSDAARSRELEPGHADSGLVSFARPDTVTRPSRA